MGSRPIILAPGDLLVPDSSMVGAWQWPQFRQSLVANIWKQEFEEMEELLPVGFGEGDGRDSGKGMTWKKGHRHLHLAAMLWHIFVVLAPYEPNAVPELMAYVGIIIGSPKCRLRYDLVFR